MRLLILLLIAISIGVYAYRPVTTGQGLNIASYIYYSPCERTIFYSAGSVDPRFGISQDKFIRLIDDAAKSWNEVTGKPFLMRAAEDSVSVNMVYDERQQLSSKVVNLQDTLKSEKRTLDQQEKEYQADAAAFQQKLSDFKSQVDYWNSHGGAPSNVYDTLQREQNDLKNEADRLNAIAEKLNLSGGAFNSQVNEYQGLVGEFAQEVKKRPEEGQYDSGQQRIDIFFYTNETDLIHTLVHEFGHAVGLGHLSDPSAVMYMYTNKTVVPNVSDRKALTDYCQKRLIYEVAASRLKFILNYLNAHLLGNTAQE